MAFYLWWLTNIWIPAQMCAQTLGAYQPSEPQAQLICQALLAPGGQIIP